MKQKCTLLLSFLCLTILLQAQTSTAPQTVNVGGGNNDNSTSYYRYEWSIGEASSIETFSSSTLIVTTGVIQPGTNTPAQINSAGAWGIEEIKILPNPVATVLEVDILSKQKGKLSMMMIDAQGKLMGSRQFDYYGIGRIEKWDMQRFANAEYFLKIILEPFAGSVGKKGAFKIQKIK